MNKSRVFFGLCFLLGILFLSYGVKTSVEKTDETVWTKSSISKEIKADFPWKEELSLLGITNEPQVNQINDRSVFDCVERMFSLNRFKACNLRGKNDFFKQDFLRAKNIFSDYENQAMFESQEDRANKLFDAYFRSFSIEKSLLKEEDLKYFEDLYLSFKGQLLSSPNPGMRAYYLYALGDLGLQLWTENRDMEGVLFFTELILENSETELAKMAWMNLNSHIQFAYSGSAGIQIPENWQVFIDDLQKIAFWGYPIEYFQSARYRNYY